MQYSCLKPTTDRGAGGLQSTGSQRIGPNWSDLAATVAANHSWFLMGTFSLFTFQVIIDRYIQHFVNCLGIVFIALFHSFFFRTLPL